MFVNRPACDSNIPASFFAEDGSQFLCYGFPCNNNIEVYGKTAIAEDMAQGCKATDAVSGIQWTVHTFFQGKEWFYGTQTQTFTFENGKVLSRFMTFSYAVKKIGGIWKITNEHESAGGTAPAEVATEGEDAGAAFTITVA